MEMVASGESRPGRVRKYMRIGTDVVAKAAPDGYTLMIVSSGTFGVNPSLYPDLPYRPLVDFLPITNIFLVPLVIVANPSFPASTLADAHARASEVEERLRAEHPEIADVIVHTEP